MSDSTNKSGFWDWVWVIVLLGLTILLLCYFDEGLREKFQKQFRQWHQEWTAQRERERLERERRALMEMIVGKWTMGYPPLMGADLVFQLNGCGRFVLWPIGSVRRFCYVCLNADTAVLLVDCRHRVGDSDADLDVKLCEQGILHKGLRVHKEWLAMRFRRDGDTLHAENGETSMQFRRDRARGVVP